mmetsp:Transcript_15941/g.46852  ORF Transcript_15941/g.46852 Transcript_15941/m.46852 type:complete len:83 (-) Transcript_15941:292-540(-)
MRAWLASLTGSAELRKEGRESRRSSAETIFEWVKVRSCCWLSAAVDIGRWYCWLVVGLQSEAALELRSEKDFEAIISAPCMR